MRNPILAAVLVILLSGCVATYTEPPASSSVVDPMDAQTIHVKLSRKLFSRKCVGKTTDPGKTCKRYPRNNITCAGIGDTIVWSWKGSSSVEFKITNKTGFTSPFVASANCTDRSGRVICTIDQATPENTFFDYNIEVNGGKGCDLDPRLLIYRR